MALKMDKNYNLAKTFLSSINKEIAQMDIIEKKEAKKYFDDGVRAIYASNYKK